MKKFYFSLLLLLSGVALHAQISINITSPLRYHPYDTVITVTAGVTSVHAVASVTAAVNGRQTALQQTSTGYGFYTGTLRIADLPLDTLRLKVTAKDVQGNQADSTLDFVHDPPPVLTVEGPVNHILGRPSFRFKATATDNEPLLNFYLGGVTFKGNHVDTVLTLPSGSYNLVAIDSRFQQTRKTISVVNEISPYLVPYFSLPDGRIWDFRNNRVFTELNNVISIRDLQRNTEEVIPFAQPLKKAQLAERAAWLTTDGAVFTTEASKATSTNVEVAVYQWRRRRVTLLADNVTHVKVSGDYLIWQRADSLFLRNLQTGRQAFVDKATQHYKIQADVAENGLVAYTKGDVNGTDFGLFKYHDGVTTKVAGRPASQSFYGFTDIYTDGRQIAYVSDVDFHHKLYLVDGLTSIFIDELWYGEYQEDVNSHRVAVNNGYMAYATRKRVTTSTSNPQRSVFLRNPQGGSKLLFTALGSRFVDVAYTPIKALATNGNIMFFAVGENTPPGTYYSDTTGHLKRITEWDFDHAYIAGNKWYVSLKNLLFRLTIDSTLDPNILPFTKQTRRNTPVNFTAKDFLDHYTGPDTGYGKLTKIMITAQPRNGTLGLRRPQSPAPYLEKPGPEIPRELLDSMYYMPKATFQGNDTIRWKAYNGADYTPYDTFIVVQVHHTLSQPPKLHRLDTVYCHSSGAQVVKILNLPHPNWDVAVTARLDNATNLPIGADSTFTINPAAYTPGMHNVTVTFATALDTVHTSVDFRIIENVQPAFTLTAWPNPVPAGTDTVVITATYTSRFNGMKYPQFAFAWDSQFTKLLQAEGNRHTFRLAVNRLTADSTPVYVRMKARGACFTDSVLTQSITIIREDASPLRLQPAISAVNGKMLDDAQGTGPVRAYPNPFSQQFTVTGLLPDRTYILSLFDQEGRLLLRRKVYHQNKADVLDNFRLGKGIYLLQVFDEQEKQVTATLKLMHL